MINILAKGNNRSIVRAGVSVVCLSINTMYSCTFLYYVLCCVVTDTGQPQMFVMYNAYE